MKKLLALVLALVMIFTLASCGNTERDDQGESSSKPAAASPIGNYAYILRVSINPEIDFTVDKDGKVISAKGNNADGNALLPNVTYINVACADAVRAMVERAIEKGYLEDGGEIRLSIVEEEVKGLDKAAILNAAEAAVAALADARDMTFNVVTGLDTNDDTSSTPSDDVSSKPDNDSSNTTPDTPSNNKDEDNDNTAVSGTLNPKTDLPYEKEYAGNFSVHGNELWGYGFSFHAEGGIDGPFILMLSLVFEDAQTDPDQTYITYNGTKYYSMGAGQTPYNMELTDTEIIVKNSFYEEDPTTTMKLTLKSNNTFVVTYSISDDYPVGTVLSFLR